MGNVLKFPKRNRAGLLVGLPLALAVGFAAAWFAPSFSRVNNGITPARAPVARALHEASPAASFSMCGRGARDNCVIDGDTFYFRGEKIRIADIDAPETHPSQCAREEYLGDRATDALLTLLNAGAFALEPGGDGRDTDVYGRKLRIVTRGSDSIGAILIARGLAHPWVGHKLPWC